MTILRNGSHEISPMEKLHNNHLFDGKNNKLSMSRNYTTDFECKYSMNYYPFDIQLCNMKFISGVNDKNIIHGVEHVLPNHELSFKFNFCNKDKVTV